jgi:splicing factor 3A subunit 3
VFGKYLDLHALYMEFCNLQNISSKNLDYLQYLDKFNSFFYIPENLKITKGYGNYINHLWEYLSVFFTRIQPLVALDEMIANWKVDFEVNWKSGSIPGWSPPRAMPATPQALRLGMFNSPEELEALGLERLKEGLMSLGLKCGGTLRQRAERLWSVRGKKADDIPVSLKQKSKGEGEMTVSSGEENRKQVMLNENNYQNLSGSM